MSWLLWSFASLVSWGTWGILPKVALQGLAWTQVFFFSSIAAFGVALAVLGAARPTLTVSASAIAPALGAGVLGAFGTAFLYLALTSGGRAGVVIPLTAAYPVLTAVLSVLILKEPFDITKLVAVGLFVAATLLVAR